MIDINKRIVELVKNGKLSLSFGATVGWALYTPDQFFKGSFVAAELPTEFFEKIGELQLNKISYQALSKGDDTALKQASALSNYCKKIALPMVAYNKKDITSRFLKASAYESRIFIGQVVEESKNRGWNCADTQAAMALAIMECERHG